MVHYTHSVFSECVVESQSQGGLGPARQIFFILPRRVVCASTRSDASMAALVRAAAARRGRIEGWDIGTGGAGARGRLAIDRYIRRRRLAALQHRPPARAVGSELGPTRVVEVEDVHRLSHAAAVQ